MIIFEIDNVLADTGHRQHFIDHKKCPHAIPQVHFSEGDLTSKYYDDRTKEIWKPDYESYNAACVDDKRIDPVIELMDGIFFNIHPIDQAHDQIQIWSGRCESAREKTSYWLHENILFDGLSKKVVLKMRPIGDDRPACEIKEGWLKEHFLNGTHNIKQTTDPDGLVMLPTNPIEMVFESDPESIAMYRRHGIYVFDCRQV